MTLLRLLKHERRFNYSSRFSLLLSTDFITSEAAAKSLISSTLKSILPTSHVSAKHSPRTKEISPSNSERHSSLASSSSSSFFLVPDDYEQPLSHVILMVVLVMSAVVGSVATGVCLFEVVRQRG